MEQKMPRLTVQEMVERYQAFTPDLDVSAVQTTLALLRAANEVYEAFETHLARHGLSQGRFGVLMLLAGQVEEGMAPSDLAHHIGVTRSTMTGLLDGLEGQGLVERCSHLGDRRKVKVRMTAQGYARLATILPDHCRRATQLVADLTGEERATLGHLVGRLDTTAVREP